MARLPDASALGERPNINPARRTPMVAQYRPTTGMEGAGASELAQSGREMEGAAVIALRAKEEADSLAAEDAFTKLREQQLNLTYGEGGIKSLKGADAVNRDLPSEFGAKLGTVTNQLSSGLANDYQRKLFARRSSVAHLEMQHTAFAHVAQQADVYATKVFKGGMDVEERVVAAGGDVNTSLTRINALIDRNAQRFGLPEVEITAQKMKAADELWSSKIRGLIDSNPPEAKRLYREHSSEIGPEKRIIIERQLREGEQKQIANGYQSAFLAARGDRRALSELEARVAADKTLDDVRKNALLGRIQSRNEVLANHAERAQARWERQIDRQINAVNAITLQGYEPTAEQMLPLVNATKGTPMEGQVQQMIATANATREFRRMLPSQQEATLASLESQARQDPTKFDVTVVSRLRTIYDNQRSQVREDPISFAVRQGFAESVPLDISKPGEIGQQISQRAALARELRRDYQAPLRLLTREEATLLSSSLKDASPKQKQDYFSGLARSTAGDRESYKAIMAQIAPDDPVTAIAGVYADGQSSKRRAASLEILRGQSLLRPNTKEDGKPSGGKLVTMPPDKDLLSDFTGETDKVFAGRPQAQSDFFQAAKAVYAAATADAGDTSGKLDSRRWKESVRAVVGDVETYKGRPIVLPDSFDATRFKDAMEAQVRVITSSGRLDPSVTRDRLSAMPLENVGDGRYVFRAGDGVLVDKDNKPVIVNFGRREE